MRWMSRAVAIAAVLTPTLATTSMAQRRSAAETGLAATSAAMPATTAAAPKTLQPASPTMTGPNWALYGGVASGDNPYDIGIAAGLSGTWHRSDWPVGVRGDFYFAHHSGDLGSGGGFGNVDASINMFGVMGGAEYSFPTTNTLKPYAFGGLGLFYSNINVDYNGVFDNDDYDSSTDLGFGVGGGIHFTPKFGLELRFMNLGGFNTIPILAALHF